MVESSRSSDEWPRVARRLWTRLFAQSSSLWKRTAREKQQYAA